jgi:hypothetical protein
MSDDLCWSHWPPDPTELWCYELGPTRKAWACRRYRTARVDGENATTSWQVGYVDLFEVDLSIERSRFGVIEISPRGENPVAVATETYDPSVPDGRQFRPAIAPSTRHGPAIPDGGCICTGHVAVDADTP